MPTASLPAASKSVLTSKVFMVLLGEGMLAVRWPEMVRLWLRRETPEQLTLLPAGTDPASRGPNESPVAVDRGYLAGLPGASWSLRGLQGWAPASRRYHIAAAH